jgi:hypothetical protein
VTRKLRAALRGGLVVRVTDAAARQVRLSARYRGQIVATGTATVGARNTAVVRLHFRRSAKRALARVRSARISVTGAGSPTTITLTR